MVECMVVVCLCAFFFVFVNGVRKCFLVFPDADKTRSLLVIVLPVVGVVLLVAAIAVIVYFVIRRKVRPLYFLLIN